MGDQWELYNQGYIVGPTRWGTNENRVERVTRGDQWEWGHRVQTMRRGLMNWGGQPVRRDQWDGGPMRWGTIGMGGAWVLIGGPMRWGTNGMGDQWDGGPLGLAENGWTNEKGDQWEGGPMSSNNVVGDLWIGAPMRRGPMRWGTNEMGDQWVGGTNEMGDQWNEWCMGANWGINEMGDQWDGGPMRWGTNEMGDQWDGGPMMCTRCMSLFVVYVVFVVIPLLYVFLNVLLVQVTIKAFEFEFEFGYSIYRPKRYFSGSVGLQIQTARARWSRLSPIICWLASTLFEGLEDRST